MKNDLSRREFFQLLAAATVLVGGARFAFSRPVEETTITILHTNDTHSQLEPFPAGSSNAGRGGAARRATFVKQVRKENPNTLLVDGGDMFQGTPYFNFYHGEVEVKTFSAIGYDVVTLGNHDFDEGVGTLASMLKYATYQVVSSNYDFGDTPLKDIVKPYVLRTLAGIKIGIFGMGVDFTGLVVADKHKGVSYRDPIEVVRPLVTKLREVEHCDLVVGLSHLGTRYAKEPERMCDRKVAQAVPGIDFIVGGHLHEFMKEPEIVKHENGRQTILFQVGYGGINVGRVDFKFTGKQLTSWKAGVFDPDGEQISQLWRGGY